MALMAESSWTTYAAICSWLPVYSFRLGGESQTNSGVDTRVPHLGSVSRVHNINIVSLKQAYWVCKVRA
ncbi:hypothetical protein M404DRAFT_1002160 [Pisolithus tinctorius Marx 270]|uniref:Uncharacterized protein n=1 Tax=Pisolithus tinctorius Marx 270 TaxID=870435 RepID=A0A0C3NNT7_PISTI|nr:hypothetical protein M404DRAFT_1002160 [Pisolithus tinctorius Marx 270]